MSIDAIPVERLKGELAGLRRQREQLRANLSMADGAIQALEQLIQAAEEGRYDEEPVPEVQVHQFGEDGEGDEPDAEPATD